MGSVAWPKGAGEVAAGGTGLVPGARCPACPRAALHGAPHVPVPSAWQSGGPVSMVTRSHFPSPGCSQQLLGWGLQPLPCAHGRPAGMSPLYAWGGEHALPFDAFGVLPGPTSSPVSPAAAPPPDSCSAWPPPKLARGARGLLSRRLGGSTQDAAPPGAKFLAAGLWHCRPAREHHRAPRLVLEPSQCAPHIPCPMGLRVCRSTPSTSPGTPRAGAGGAGPRQRVGHPHPTALLTLPTWDPGTQISRLARVWVAGGGLAFGGSPGAGGLRDGREGIMEPIPLIDSISAAAGCGARSHQFDSGDGESDLERPCHQLAFIDGIAHWKSMGFEAGGGSSIPSNPRSRTGPHHSGVWGTGPTGGCPPGATRTPWHRPGKSQWVGVGVLGWRWAVLGGGAQTPASLRRGPLGHRHHHPPVGVLQGTDPPSIPARVPPGHGTPAWGSQRAEYPQHALMGGVSWGISLTSIPISGPLGYRPPPPSTTTLGALKYKSSSNHTGRGLRAHSPWHPHTGGPRGIPLPPTPTLRGVSWHTPHPQHLCKGIPTGHSPPSIPTWGGPPAPPSPWHGSQAPLPHRASGWGRGGPPGAGCGGRSGCREGRGGGRCFRSASRPAVSLQKP